MDILEKTYFEIHAAEILKDKHLTKAAFAEKMEVKPQNVNKVFETKNITTLMRAAQVLGVPLDYLIKGDANTEKQNTIVNGFVEVNGTVYRLRSKEDMVKVLDVL